MASTASNSSSGPSTTVTPGRFVSGLPYLANRFRTFLTLSGRGGCGVQWEILMTTQVEDFLDALYEADRDSHRLVNQAIWCLSAMGLLKGGRWSTP